MGHKLHGLHACLFVLSSSPPSPFEASRVTHVDVLHDHLCFRTDDFCVVEFTICIYVRAFTSVSRVLSVKLLSVKTK